MKILSIQSSPRRSGLAAGLLRQLESQLEEAGCEICHIEVADSHFVACAGCMACRATHRCVLPPDDATLFAEKLLWADALLIATPSYWGGIPGTLKSLFDRCVYALVDTSDPQRLQPIPLHKNQKAAIISTSTTPWPFNRMARFNDVAGDLKRILRPSGYKVLPPLLIGNTKKLHAPSPSHQNKITRLAKKLTGKS